MQGSAGDHRLRVLVVDDHEMFRTGLRALLEEEGMDVADCDSADTALRRLPSFRPAVVVMDMNMPGMSGVEAIPLVHEAVPEAAVLMLTISGEGESVLHAVQNGAAGYLLKDAELGEIVGAIRSVAAGFGAVAPGVAGILLDSVRSATGSPVAGAPAPQVSLSPRESQVLALVSEGFGNGDIARHLFVSPSTVKHHVSRVLDKLGVENRVQAATFAVRSGLYDA
jgi:two-component system, NarL family, nitrate/nitrite response regulator NarL